MKEKQQQLSFLIEGEIEARESNSPDNLSAPSSVSDHSFTEVLSFPSLNQIRPSEIFTLSLKNDTAPLTHGLHRFPAKFIPQIPRWGIKEFAAKGACILDPFMGSGTTLVEGLLREGTTIGTDIDPLARLIARAKTEVPSSSRISKLGEEIANKWKEPASVLHSPMPDIDNFEHWFTSDSWGKLQALLDIINELKCSQQEREYLLVLFSSILRWVSNADDQSQKTYVSGTNKKNPPETMTAFWRSFERGFRGLKELERVKSPKSSVEVSDTGSATATELSGESVDLIVTSPPYLDSVDYMYNFMLEYFWLGPLLGVPDRKTFNSLRRKALGAKQPDQEGEALPVALNDLVDFEHIPEARKKATVSYMFKMGEHFREAARCMRDGARYVLVVGNSQTSTGIVPVHDCLIRLAALEGLSLEKAFAYRVRRHYMKFPRNGRGGIILIDWVIVLRKTSSPIPSLSRLPLPWMILGHKDVAN